jgi:hypothetical protein
VTPPTLSRTAARLLAAAAAVVVFAVVVGQLRSSAPYEPGEFLVEGAEDPTDPTNDLLTCERTLPDRPTTPEGAEGPEPVGRVTSSQVIECPEVFDGHVVTYIGEVIGDVIRRDGGAWVLMNDDAYALEVGPLSSHGEHRGYNSGLSVWLDADLADLADQPGGPAWRGDVLLVRGVVHRTDAADGGGLTLRASSGEVLSEARPLDVPLHRGQAVVAVVMVVLALGAVALERRTAARR